MSSLCVVLPFQRNRALQAMQDRCGFCPPSMPLTLPVTPRVRVSNRKPPVELCVPRALISLLVNVLMPDDFVNYPIKNIEDQKG